MDGGFPHPGAGNDPTAQVHCFSPLSRSRFCSRFQPCSITFSAPAGAPTATSASSSASSLGIHRSSGSRPTRTQPRDGAACVSFSVSADGARFAYVAPLEGKVAMVVDGRVGAPFDEILQYTAALEMRMPLRIRVCLVTCAGRNFAYAAARSGKQYVVVNGEEKGPYDEVRLFHHHYYTAFYGDRTASSMPRVVAAMGDSHRARVRALRRRPGPAGR